MATIPSTVNDRFNIRDIGDVLQTTTQAELAGRAADSIREDCFKQHVARVHVAGQWTNGANSYTNIAAVDKYFDELWVMESDRILNEYFRNKNRGSLTLEERKQFNNKTNPFRSMKSVIRAACINGVALVDEEGMPLGKTALADATKVEKDPILKAIDLLQKVQKLIPNLPDDNTRLGAVRKLLSDVSDDLARKIDNVVPF